MCRCIASTDPISNLLRKVLSTLTSKCSSLKPWHDCLQGVPAEDVVGLPYWCVAKLSHANLRMRE